MACMLIGSFTKIMLDGALFSYQLFSFLFVILFGMSYLERQEKSQMYSFFLTKPLSRAQFFWGTFLGLLVTLLITALLFYLANVISLYYLTSEWFWQLLAGYIAIAAENLILLSVGLFFSVLLSNPLTYLATFAVFATCYLNTHWYAMAQQQSGLFYGFAVTVYYLFPDLSILDIKNDVMHRLTIDWHLFAATLVYCLCFSSLLLFGTQKLFEKRFLNH